MASQVALNTNYTDIFTKIYGSNTTSKHADIFPKNIFMILAGSTGCGKTNLMLNFLMKGVLAYDDVMIYTTTPYQPSYQYLRDCNEQWKQRYKLSTDIVTFHNPDDKIVDPSELDKNKTHIIVFDDVMGQDQKVMTDYFTRGRHNNVNVFYLCQSLHQLKKHGIRQNANIFILFHQDKKTVKYFYDTHISADMSLLEFEKICENAWSTKHGYIVINIWEKAECGRYLINYTELYIPEKYIKCNKMLKNT